LRGPHDTGPDLTGYRKSQYVHVEVEVHWKHWFEHNHHKQPDFEDVDLLIVLNPSRKRCKRRNLLPPEIRNIDTEHFKSWIASSFPRCSPLEELKNLARRRYIASLLHSMWEEHITSLAPGGLLRSVIV